MTGAKMFKTLPMAHVTLLYGTGTGTRYLVPTVQQDSTRPRLPKDVTSAWHFLAKRMAGQLGNLACGRGPARGWHLSNGRWPDPAEKHSLCQHVVSEFPRKKVVGWRHEESMTRTRT